MATIYTNAVGRRKTARASGRITPATKGSIVVNGKNVKDYFKTNERTQVAEEALALAESAEHYAVQAHVEGGGIAAQAGALRHAIARAITKAEPAAPAGPRAPPPAPPHQ